MRWIKPRRLGAGPLAHPHDGLPPYYSRADGCLAYADRSFLYEATGHALLQTVQATHVVILICGYRLAVGGVILIGFGVELMNAEIVSLCAVSFTGLVELRFGRGTHRQSQNNQRRTYQTQGFDQGISSRVLA